MKLVPNIIFFFQVKKESAESEPAWQGCGQEVGVKVWRIVKFKVRKHCLNYVRTKLAFELKLNFCSFYLDVTCRGNGITKDFQYIPYDHVLTTTFTRQYFSFLIA